MAAPHSPSPAPDYFSGRPTPRTRPLPTVLPDRQRVGTPGSPRTPLLGRSISAQFGSPGSFRAEQEEYMVYELGARHLSAGFAGESRPRCIVRFTPDMGRRAGDYRQYDPQYGRTRRNVTKRKGWGEDYELYRTDIRGLDLGLVEDKLERAVRGVHSDYLQLDQKPRKAVLAVPSLLPTPLLEIALKVLFTHYTQPPSVMILTTPILACVSAGLRNTLVVDVGWEETVVTAVGEYKEVCQRRSVRAGKMLTREMAKVLEEVVRKAGASSGGSQLAFEHAEDVMERMGWCRPRREVEEAESTKSIPLLESHSKRVAVPFKRLSEPAEDVLFATSATKDELDDHDLPLHHLAYRVLLALPLDLRAVCISRILLTGGVSNLPGLKLRLLSELNQLISQRGWDSVSSYGSAKPHHDRMLRERSANTAAFRQRPPDAEPPLSPAKKPIQDSVPPSRRLHDDIKDPITLKAERNHSIGRRNEDTKAVIRGVETLGAWAGASLVASLRVKGVHEVEREEFTKHGLRDGGAVY